VRIREWIAYRKALDARFCTKHLIVQNRLNGPDHLKWDYSRKHRTPGNQCDGPEHRRIPAWTFWSRDPKPPPGWWTPDARPPGLAESRAARRWKARQSGDVAARNRTAMDEVEAATYGNRRR
jgi:hypothetical protein